MNMRKTMLLSRRSLLLAAPALALAPSLALVPTGARADDDPRMAPRFVGSPDAPVTVVEWFSLTCPHCARFARDTLPQIHKELIEPGKLRYGYGDFPLDQVALTAAMIARSLPPARYEPFILALLASQDRWAFARGVNNTEEVFKMAALAGMSRATFDATIADTKLRDAILAAQDAAQKTVHVDSTPTFIFDGPTLKGKKASGEMSFDAFAQVVKEVGGSAN
jgi:protein-disulfide isomerase